MDIKDTILITLMYVLIILLTLYNEIREIKKCKKVKMHNYISFFIILFYCITPIIYLISKNINNVETKFSNNYITEQAKYYYLQVFMTLVTYIFLKLGNKIKVTEKRNKDFKIVNIESKSFAVAAIILCLIGWVALLMWTRVYGMPWDIFPYASQIRSGIVEINNPYTFVKPLCPILIIASYCFFLILLETKKKNKFIYVIFFIISVVGSIIYSIANDGRLMMILFILVPIIYVIFRKKEKINFVKLFIIAVITLIILGNLDSITYYIRNGEIDQKQNENSLSKIIADELAFAHMNVINTLYMRENGIITEYTWLQDIKNVFFSWVPERIKPDSIVTLYELNTSKYFNITGTLPTDLITAGIYKYGSWAFFILPFIVGILIKFLEVKLSYPNDKFREIIMILLSVYLGLKIVGYYDLSVIIFGVFYIVISYIIVIIMNNIKMEER